MGKQVRNYKVENLNKVDTSRYIEGDIFMTNRTVGILVDGKIKVINLNAPSLKNYVQKKDVQKMIDKALKGDNNA